MARQKKPLKQPISETKTATLKQEKLTEELLSAFKELSLRTQETEAQTQELTAANEKLILRNNKLRKLDENQREYIRLLNQMMFITSHKIRQPVAHILGLSNILETLMHSPEDLKSAVGFIKQAAEMLDTFTKELTLFIHEQEVKLRK